MASKFKFTEHTASEWASLTPAKNEYCIATETKTTLYKIGNGSYTYANLPFRSFEDFKNVNTNLPDIAKRETLKRLKDHIDVIDSLGVGGGTAQAQTITYTQDIVLTVGKQFTYTPSVSNTATAPTININGLGAKTVILGTNVASGTALIASDITINVPCIIIYDGTNFRLQNPQSTPAASVKVTPTGGIVATNVQAALAEIDGEVSELELKEGELNTNLERTFIESIKPHPNVVEEGAYIINEKGEAFAEYTKEGFDSNPSISFINKIARDIHFLKNVYEQGAFFCNEKGEVFLEYKDGVDVILSDSLFAKFSFEEKRTVINILNTDTEIEVFTKMKQAFDIGNCDVFWETGTYTFSEVYIYMRDTIGWTWTMGLPIGNFCRYFFNNSTLISNKPSGAYIESRNILDCKASTQTFELYDGTLVNNGGTYCVHDETRGNIGLFRHEYHRMTMKYYIGDATEGLSKCIGCGTGTNGTYIIDKCKFSTDNTSQEVSWHGHNASQPSIGGQSIFYISNCYFSKGISEDSGAADQEIMTLNFCNNSYVSNTLVSSENFVHYIFNNETRI